ncbi:helix-turn-helix domain-containing protein [Roseburia hominis]
MRNSQQYNRMVRYFVEAARSIIDTEGEEAVTARKVADAAGYNVATLYHYFENLDHLLFFTSLRHLKDYALDLPEYTKGVYDPIQLYLMTWECFNQHAFRLPQIYARLFLPEYQTKYNHSLRFYYEIFPEELPKNGLRFFPMFQQGGLYERDYVLLIDAARRGLLRKEDVADISIMNTMIFKGMINKFLGSSPRPSIEQAMRDTMRYQSRTLIGFGVSREYVKDYL